jgi:hypothetical protein
VQVLGAGVGKRRLGLASPFWSFTPRARDIFRSNDLEASFSADAEAPSDPSDMLRRGAASANRQL